MRDQKTKELFIKYLEDNKDLRFYQAISNFTESLGFGHYCGTAETPEGKNFRDLFYIEADEYLPKEK